MYIQDAGTAFFEIIAVGSKYIFMLKFFAVSLQEMTVLLFYLEKQPITPWGGESHFFSPGNGQTGHMEIFFSSLALEKTVHLLEKLDLFYQTNAPW